MDDFSGKLRRAILLAHEAGLVDSAVDLQQRAFAAYTTSSEWLGEVGEAIREFLAREGRRAPVEAVELLEECLADVAKVWPRYGS